MTKVEAVNFLKNNPYKFGHLLGFTKLTELHNKWLRSMILEKQDYTLQAHRLSYKTTCVSIAIALLMILKPNKRIFFCRKTDTDVAEIVKQVLKILHSEYTQVFVSTIYGVNLKILSANNSSITTNLMIDIKGTSQFTAQGIGGSLTGKHYDYIFTDDIVNVNDRISKAERDRTKLVYQELQNIKMRDGRIFNTGTPWHVDDCFSIMPTPEVWDCYSTNLISETDLQKLKDGMTASLFAANYELRHIASEDVIFTEPQTHADECLVEQGESHIDAAYGGEDYTAFTICRKKDGKYYVFGKCWRKHVDDVIDTILEYHAKFNAGQIAVENNGDKGYLAKALRQKGARVYSYHEDMNKFLKITSYLKAEWKNVVFVNGTDEEYIRQITDYTENAEHDDCPDSLSCMVRRLWRKTDDNEYQPILYK